MFGESSERETQSHALRAFNARQCEGLVVNSRRGMLKAGLAGMAGLSLTELLKVRSEAARVGVPMASGKSVILLWLAGGPSHIDTWDTKPDRPPENRGPFSVIQTKVPGVNLCEHLPKQAAMLDKFSIIRSFDARGSDHGPNRIFQTGNREARPRTNPVGDMYPAIGSVVAKHHGANQRAVPPYAAFIKSETHVAYSGYLGKQYDPFIADYSTKLPVYTDVGVDTGKVTRGDAFRLPSNLTHEQLYRRRDLLRQMNQLREYLEDGMDGLDAYRRMAVDMLVGGRMQHALDISQEPEKTRHRYGSHLWHQQALLARRMVEAGVAFVTIDLSYHGSSGTWDNHGDNIPPYGGISKGLRPLLPLLDHLLTTLVGDLDERGMLDDVLLIAMGEFGRSPQLGTQGSTDGRNHWPRVMSVIMAGGGFRHGQVIGSTEKDGGDINTRPVTPGDLAATIYHHMGVPLDTTYTDFSGRPRFIVDHGEPIAELI